MLGLTSRDVVRTVLAAATYLVLAVVLLDPLFFHMSAGQIDPESVFGGFLGGPRLDVFTWTLTWEWHALTSGLSIFDAPIHPPMSSALAATYTKLGHLPIFGPVYALSGNPILASQLTTLLNLVLSATALFVLARSWKLPVSAAFVSGFLYAFAPVRIRNLFDPSLLAGQYLPIALLLLDRLLAKPRISTAVAAALFLLWQMLCAAPYASATLPIAFAYVVARSLVAPPRPGVAGWLAVLGVGAAAWVPTWYAQAATTRAVAAGELGVPNPLATRGAISWTGFLTSPGKTLPWELNLVAEPHYGCLAAVLVVVAVACLARRAGKLWRRTVGALAIAMVGYVAALGDRFPRRLDTLRPVDAAGSRYSVPFGSVLLRPVPVARMGAADGDRDGRSGTLVASPALAGALAGLGDARRHRR